MIILGCFGGTIILGNPHIIIPKILKQFAHVCSCFFSTVFGFQGGLCSSKAPSSTKIHLERSTTCVAHEKKKHQKKNNRNFRQSIYRSPWCLRGFGNPWFSVISLWQYHPFHPFHVFFSTPTLQGLEGEHGGSQIVGSVKPHGLGGLSVDWSVGNNESESQAIIQMGGSSFFTFEVYLTGGKNSPQILRAHASCCFFPKLEVWVGEESTFPDFFRPKTCTNSLKLYNSVTTFCT